MSCSVWRALTAGGLTAAIAGLLLLQGLSCKEPALVPDAAVVIPVDAGGKNCDAEPNSWTLRDIGLAVQAGDEAANLFAVWGHSPSAIFAVGSRGKAIFFDGTSWQDLATPTEVDLKSVWGTSPTDVWAVGLKGTVLHYDGTSWTAQPPPLEVFLPAGTTTPPQGDAAIDARRDLWGVWVAGSTVTEALYAVGNNGTALLLKGNAWSRIETNVEENLNGVWGASASQVFIVGDFGTVLTGSTTLTKGSTGIAKNLNSVWGRGANDVYAIGLNGIILHFDGSGWSGVDGAPKQFLAGMWGDGGSLWVVGWDGTLFRLEGGAGNPTFHLFNCVTPRRLNGIWGTQIPAPPGDGGPSDAMVPAVWIAGVSGTVITGP